MKGQKDGMDTFDHKREMTCLEVNEFKHARDSNLCEAHHAVKYLSMKYKGVIHWYLGVKNAMNRMVCASESIIESYYVVPRLE
jgi:hypothetical protein